MKSRQIRIYSEIAKNISIAIIAWALLLTGFMQVQARAWCLEYKAPRAIVTYSGILCTGVVNGTEIAVPLDVVRENYSKK